MYFVFYFMPCSAVSIVNFEQVIASWEIQHDLYLRYFSICSDWTKFVWTGLTNCSF